MATGNYFNSLGFRFFVKAGTTSSSAPTSSAGMTEVLSLTDASIQSQSESQEVTDYGSSLGFKTQIVTSTSYSIPCQMNLDLRDAGYQALKDAAMKAATGVTVQWYRESPEMTSTGSAEYHSGVAFVTDFTEQLAAGNIAQVSFTLTGVGAFTWVAETDA